VLKLCRTLAFIRTTVPVDLLLHFVPLQQGAQYSAKKSSYQYMGDRHVWLGQLDGQVGKAGVVWNAACDPNVFQLEVNLAHSSDGTSNTITTVPCSAAPGNVTGCLWTAQVSTQRLPELEPIPVRYEMLLSNQKSLQSAERQPAAQRAVQDAARPFASPVPAPQC
jgi:hypothetical protein